MEIETAVKLAKNLSDLKLNTAVKEVQDALSRKVDKPTEEQVTRRTVRMWKTGIADKQNDQATVELGKFQSALTAPGLLASGRNPAFLVESLLVLLFRRKFPPFVESLLVLLFRRKFPPFIESLIVLLFLRKFPPFVESLLVLLFR